MDKIIIEQTGIKQQVINEICELAQKYNVEQVLLFGSRSRGDYKRTSDIDLAVKGGDIDRFALDVEEETTTLLEYDIVDMSREMQDELRQSIMREGKILYEKESTSPYACGYMCRYHVLRMQQRENR